MAGNGGGTTAKAEALEAWSGEGFTHEALLFDEVRQLTDRCLPFVHEAMAAHQPVLVMAGDHTWAALNEQLGDAAERLEVVGRAEAYWLGGHETLLEWDRAFRRMAATGSPWRLIAEPIWLEAAHGQEWHRFESTCNRLFAPFCCYSLCPHDARRFRDETLRTVRQTHPWVSDGHGAHLSADFVDPEQLVPSLEPPWSLPPEQASHRDVAMARQGRAVAMEAAEVARLRSRCDDIVLAVDEVVTNSLEHCGAAAIDYWCHGPHLYVQISDEGTPGIDVLAGYFPPVAASESGRGLWLARTLADDATLRSGPEGNSVRLLFELPVTG